MKSDLDIKDAKALIKLIVPLVDKLEDYINDLREISETVEIPEGWNGADDPPDLNHHSWVGDDGEFIEFWSSDPVRANVVGFDTQPAIFSSRAKSPLSFVFSCLAMVMDSQIPQ